MRIVYLHQYFVTPEMTGGSRSYEMARRLVAAGHEVHMVTSDQGGDSVGKWKTTVESGIQVHWTPVAYNNTMGYSKRIFAFIKFAWRAALKATAVRGDIIFATSTPLSIALPAVYASKRCKIPMVFEVRDLWPAVPIAIGALSNPILKQMAIWLEKFAYRNASRIVALAPGMRDEIIATGYPREQVTVIPNGCDLDVFEDREVAINVRGLHPWLEDRPLLVFTGTFGLVNGMDYLVHLSDAIRRINPDMRIVAVGGGREFERVKLLATETGVLENNLFLLGQMSKTETARWVMAADMTLALFTGPEIVWRDAVQNKFFDSLAAGKPVVNNFSGWQARVATDVGAGLIVSATNYDQAAKDIVNALANEAWMTAAGRAAHDLARNRFDRNKLAMDLLQVLEDAHSQAR